MTHEQKAENIMKLLREQAPAAEILSVIIRELRQSYKEGYSNEEASSRNRAYNSHYGHDMGQ